MVFSVEMNVGLYAQQKSSTKMTLQNLQRIQDEE